MTASTTTNRQLTQAVSAVRQEEARIFLYGMPPRWPHQRTGIAVELPRHFPVLEKERLGTVMVSQHTEAELLDMGLPAFYAGLQRVDPHHNYVSCVCNYSRRPSGGSSIHVVCSRRHRAATEFQRLVFSWLKETVWMEPEGYAHKYKISYTGHTVVRTPK